MRIDYVLIHPKDLAGKALSLSEHDGWEWFKKFAGDLALENENSDDPIVRECLKTAKENYVSRQERTRAARIKRGLAVDDVQDDDGVSGGGPQRGDGGSGHEVESPAAPADAEPKAHKLTAAEITFERFRRAFGGNKRGLDSEFKNFVRKHKDWKAALPLLMPALEKERAWRQRCADIGAFCPEWAMLSTWINQRRWEQELAEPSAPVAQKTARQLENEKNERETAEWIQSLGKEKNAEPKGFLDDLSRDILGGMKNG